RRIQEALSGIAGWLEAGTGYRLSGHPTLADGPGGLSGLK
ncbi:MAG: hypothetical protein JWO76_1801, partial [Nocardioides sp.]|nr:hypothetical protein [Nocardioides sp.]